VKLREPLGLVVVLVAALLLPLGLRALGPLAPASALPESYLPALEPRRAREPFDAGMIENLRTIQPEFVVIGDSMAGSRLDATQLSVMLNYRMVAPIYYAATGSAFWYLALKNWVVASQVHPRIVIIFFRDENLTDPMFRVTGPYRATLDAAARDREPALNDVLAMHTAGAFYRVHDAIGRVYGNDALRAWVEPALTRAPVPLAARRHAKKPSEWLERMNADLFGLQALREMTAADMAQAEDARAFDFRRNVPRSLLPRMFDVARRGGIRLAFVRVQRRPEVNGPPPQSPALRSYTAALKAYIEAQGGLFFDDWGDPDQPLSVYTDGDHVSKDFRERYTAMFPGKHPAIFQ
jgi:hypothetical protein